MVREVNDYHENYEGEGTSVRVPCSGLSSLPMVRILRLAMVWILLLSVVGTPKQYGNLRISEDQTTILPPDFLAIDN